MKSEVSLCCFVENRLEDEILEKTELWKFCQGLEIGQKVPKPLDDLIDALLTVTEKYPYGEPFNVASGTPTTVTELVETITDIYGYKPIFNYDTTKPVMIPKRLVDVSKINARLGWKANHTSKEGLEKTIKWYKENK